MLSMPEARVLETDRARGRSRFGLSVAAAASDGIEFGSSNRNLASGLLTAMRSNGSVCWSMAAQTERLEVLKKGFKRPGRGTHV
jgi:hypothetical protein